MNVILKAHVKVQKCILKAHIIFKLQRFLSICQNCQFGQTSPGPQKYEEVQVRHC